MATQERYRLKLSKLQFCSLVDQPAQPHARTLLIKRAPAGDKIKAEARFVKASDELGLAFFWAFTSTNPDGSDHFDLQGDNIDQEFIKAAMDFMVDGGGAVDEMHSNRPGAGRVVFAMPMTPEIAKAFGVVTKTSGLMIAIKPGADQLAKLKDGTYNGVSIGGLGEREAIKRLAKNHLFARVLKEAVLTSETDGHQHALDLDEPTSEWREMYTTSYQLVVYISRHSLVGSSRAPTRATRTPGRSTPRPASSRSARTLVTRTRSTPSCRPTCSPRTSRSMLRRTRRTSASPQPHAP
jgi:hypothetical protein